MSLRPGSRLAAGALAVVGLLGGVAVSGVVAVPGAGADPVGQCTTTAGVMVAVDFSTWGGQVERGCALTPQNGMAALQSAGFGVVQVATQPGFVCQITDPVSGAAQPASVPGGCNVTPPSSAYWSYWHADAGSDAWTYSQLGAVSATPGPGSVDAWVFGAASASGGGPAFSPDQVRATNPLPLVTTSPTTTPAPPVTTATTATTAPTPSTTVPPVAAVSPPTTVPPSPRGAHASPRIVDVPAGSSAEVRATASQTGSPLPLVAGAAAVALLAGASYVAVRRRRRAG